MIDFLTKWFILNSNGDWEFENSIKLYTMSDPAWKLEFDINDTILEDTYYFDEYNVSTLNWIKISIANKKLIGECSPNNLEKLLLTIYHKIIQINSSYKNSFIYQAYFEIKISNFIVYYPVEIVTQDFNKVNVIFIEKFDVTKFSAHNIKEVEKFIEFLSSEVFEFEHYKPSFDKEYDFVQVRLFNGCFPCLVNPLASIE